MGISKSLFYVFLICLYFISCSKQESDETKVELKIPPLKNLSKNLQKSRIIAKADDEPTAPYAPEDLSGFDCVMVNVVGDGIGNWGANKNKVGVDRNFSYFGTFSQMVSTETGGVVTVRIKKGSLRYIQLIGVRSNVGCPENVTSNDLDSIDKFPGLFIIGAIEKNIFEDQAISITPSYSVESTNDLRYETEADIPEVIDEDPPTVGTFTVTSQTATTARASWGAASDEATLGKYLSYKLVLSNVETEIDSIDKVKNASGTNVVMDWTTNKTSQNISELDSSKDYFFSLIVKDPYDNMSLYPMDSIEASCTCDDGQYYSDGKCNDADIGSWAASCELHECTNKPTNSSYIGTAQTSSSCVWTCDNGYVPNADFTACVSNVGYIALGCAANEVMTGLYGRSGSVLDKLGARCRTFNGNVQGASKNGTSFGGEGGGPFTADCGDGKAVAEIFYSNTIFLELPVLGQVKFKCVDIATGTVDVDWTGPFGEVIGTTGTLSCPAGEFYSWISMGSSGPYTGDMNGLFGCKK